MRIKSNGVTAVQEQRIIKLTSAEWQKILPKVQVWDTDGWDGRNFQFSWFEEKIDRNEYERRLAQSTVRIR